MAAPVRVSVFSCGSYIVFASIVPPAAAAALAYVVFASVAAIIRPIGNKRQRAVLLNARQRSCAEVALKFFRSNVAGKNSRPSVAITLVDEGLQCQLLVAGL